MIDAFAFRPGFIAAFAALAVALTLMPATGRAQSGEPQLVAQFGAWGVYTASPEGKKVCFALSKPTSSATNPPGRSRDPGYIFISTRPAENVKEEFSANYGYPLQGDGEISVGGTSFSLYTQGEGGWIKNAAEEPTLVDALRKGADATVKGTSTRGTETTDVYSLQGVTQALQRAGQECN